MVLMSQEVLFNNVTYLHISFRETLTMMTPLEVQTPIWPTNGMSQLMKGIGVHTIQRGNCLGGMMLIVSLSMADLLDLNSYRQPSQQRYKASRGDTFTPLAMSTCVRYEDILTVQ